MFRPCENHRITKAPDQEEEKIKLSDDLQVVVINQRQGYLVRGFAEPSNDETSCNVGNHHRHKEGVCAQAFYELSIDVAEGGLCRGDLRRVNKNR